MYNYVVVKHIVVVLSFFRYFYKQQNFYYKERKAKLIQEVHKRQGFHGGVIKMWPSDTIDRSVNEDVMVGNLHVSNAMHKLVMCLKYLSGNYW